MMPDGWREVSLGELGSCLRGVSYNPEVDLSDRDAETTVRLLRSNNVQQSFLKFEDVQYVNEARVSVEQLLRPADIVVCMANGSKALVGKSGLFTGHESVRYTFGAFMGCFRTDRAKASPGFVRYLFLTKLYQDYINNLLAGSAINNLAPSSIESLKFVVPSIHEQQGIAEALSDADALVESLDALIAKKRDMKQAVMQQLLTGRTRLLGYDEEWTQTTVGQITGCVAGGTPSTAVPAYWGGAIRWMSSGELNLKRVEEVSGRITELGLQQSSAQLVPPWSVLIGLAGQGKTRGTAALNLIELSTNQSIAAVLPSTNHDSKFLYYVMDTKYQLLRDLSDGGGGRGGLNLSLIRGIEILLPPIEEQTAIAAVLWDLDDEIDALVAQREKADLVTPSCASADLVKQGMMQELLSGRVRLV